jgi:hypothetical protein
MAASAIEVMAPVVVAWVRKQQVAPELLDLVGLAADNGGHQRALQQLDHRVAAGADGVAVAGAGDAVRIGDAYDRGFLRHEGLDGVDPLHLGDQVDHQHFDPRDPRHGFLPEAMRTPAESGLLCICEKTIRE